MNIHVIRLIDPERVFLDCQLPFVHNEKIQNIQFVRRNRLFKRYVKMRNHSEFGVQVKADDLFKVLLAEFDFNTRVLLLTNYGIFDEVDGEVISDRIGGQAITGRSAIVNVASDKSSHIARIICHHEWLHVHGFDHCLNSGCIMRSVENTDDYMNVLDLCQKCKALI